VLGSGHDPVATAEYLLAVRDLLVLDRPMGTDRPASAGPGPSAGADLHEQGLHEQGLHEQGLHGQGLHELVLAPVVPSSWLGQSWEVHGLPTSVGTLGYAVRWHGQRAALLWEIEPFPGVAGVRLRAPGLDASWSGSGWSGEALLGVLPAGSAGAGPVEVDDGGFL